MIILEQPADMGLDRIKVGLDEALEAIKWSLGSQQGEIRGFNAWAAEAVAKEVAARKARLKAQDGLPDILGIPLKRRDGAPTVAVLPMQRKLVRPLPPPPSSGYQPEPGISADDYDHIIRVIRHGGRTFETAPKTFGVHDEEGLRDILLANLNTHYEGAATGETFRRRGKTDIRIEDHERCAFVAECKVWRGQKDLIDAVDQLLSYLTWRDCKAAIIVFNKHIASFSSILDSAPKAVARHVHFKRELHSPAHGEWRVAMAVPGDPTRQVIVTFFAFNLHE